MFRCVCREFSGGCNLSFSQGRICEYVGSMAAETARNLFDLYIYRMMFGTSSPSSTLATKRA